MRRCKKRLLGFFSAAVFFVSGFIDAALWVYTGFAVPSWTLAGLCVSLGVLTLAVTRYV